MLLLGFIFPDVPASWTVGAPSGRIYRTWVYPLFRTPFSLVSFRIWHLTLAFHPRINHKHLLIASNDSSMLERWGHFCWSCFYQQHRATTTATATSGIYIASICRVPTCRPSIEVNDLMSPTSSLLRNLVICESYTLSPNDCIKELFRLVHNTVNIRTPASHCRPNVSIAYNR